MTPREQAQTQIVDTSKSYEHHFRLGIVTWSTIHGFWWGRPNSDDQNGPFQTRKMAIKDAAGRSK